MVTLVTVIHVFAAIFLILIVLLQTGKGSGMGASFGGSSQTVFGAGGATSFLTKLTAASAVIFMVTSLTLAYFSTRAESSLERATKAKTVMMQQKAKDLSTGKDSSAVPAGTDSKEKKAPAEGQ